MDVDTASYAVTRRFLEDGNMPDRDSVRLEEFVNSFDYGYRSPDDSAFAIHLDGGAGAVHRQPLDPAAHRHPGTRDQRVRT